MNKNRILRLTLGASLLLFAACSQDETTEQGTILPEGKYPLQIGSVTMSVESSERPWGADAPQTRVAENADGNSSTWQNGDKISVQIGDGTPGTYTYTDGNLTVAEGDTTAYWASKDDGQTITAWYTNPKNNPTNGNNVTLSDQTTALAYVITAQATANFNQSVPLTFSHKLAKVRVVLTGGKANDVTAVSIKNYTSCNVNNGTVTPGTAGYIAMHQATYGTLTCWEANVVPGTTLKDNAFEIITTDGKTATASLISEIALTAATVHTVTLTIDKKPTEITGGATITTPGD